MKTWFSMKAGAVADEIDIFDEIGFWGVTAKDFISQLKGLKGQSITLSINSPGGSVFDAIAMYNALRNTGKEITVRVMGVAASAASLIAMAGDKIVMPENTFMMVHNPLTGTYGNADDLREMADVLDKIGASLIATYCKRTGKSEDEVKALLDAETYLTAAEAVELGFADEVEPVLAIAASFEIDRLPENVQDAFKNAVVQTTVTTTTWTEGDTTDGDSSADDAPTATLADTVAAATAAAGMSEFSAVFALAVTDKAQLEAAIGEAREIKSLCAVAGKPELAAQMIRNRKSVADTRAALLDALASQDEQQITDGSLPLAGTPKIEKPTAGITTAGIWASRRQHSDRS